MPNHFKCLLLAGSLVIAASALAEEAQMRSQLDMRQLMEWVLDPASAVIWNSTGSIYTEEGEISLAPQDQEGWDNVRNMAAVAVEVGNLLLMPERAMDDAEWKQFSIQLSAAGLKSIAAAEAQDEDALFMAGSDLYESCAGCHAAYLPVSE